MTELDSLFIEFISEIFFQRSWNLQFLTPKAQTQGTSCHLSLQVTHASVRGASAFFYNLFISFYYSETEPLLAEAILNVQFTVIQQHSELRA
jgi:hypothetical protein